MRFSLMPDSRSLAALSEVLSLLFRPSETERGSASVNAVDTNRLAQPGRQAGRRGVD